MSKGYSLHLGLNQLDAQSYPGIQLLKASLNDAMTWQKFARKKGYATKRLTDSRANSSAIIKQITLLNTTAKAGDIVLITYSGHGGEIPNNLPGRKLPEAFDQTWCLYDRQLIDDELYDLFSKFKKGVRILVVSDSCHSGTVTKDPENLKLGEAMNDGIERLAGQLGQQSKKLNKTASRNNILVNRDLYEAIQQRYHHYDPPMKASVKLLAACQDDEVTFDGEVNSIFTEAMMSLLQTDEGRSASAKKLINYIAYSDPKPNLFEYGGIIPSYDRYSPFEIDIPEAKTVTGQRKPKKSDFILRPREKTYKKWSEFKGSIPARLLLIYTDRARVKLSEDIKVKIVDDQQRGTFRYTTIELTQIANEHAWSAAHALSAELVQYYPDIKITPILSVSPAADGRVSREADLNNPDYLPDWPPAKRNPAVAIGWHLDEAHSQLHAAYEQVMRERPGAHVRIAHLDTGYMPHPSLPSIDTAHERSFMPGEDPTLARDTPGTGGQEGHGLGTITLLAGRKATKQQTFNEFEGLIGGAPLAEVVPMRISDSVVIWNTDHFCQAVDYAIAQQCEVISMSMAGKPDKQMAEAVNRAYEAGIVIVSAAGNCWYKGVGTLLPNCVLFPAGFPRVIAATGVMYDDRPYDHRYLNRSKMNISTKYMQGSYGPASRMKYALAGYTPNTPWATTSLPFVKSGGGTSSATPQIAAAAALWIAYHRSELEDRGYYQPGNKWKKVEAVRNALFKSAGKQTSFDQWQKFYGNGILKARAALDVGVVADSELKKAQDAKVFMNGWGQLLSSLFDPFHRFKSGDSIDKEALAAELVDLMQIDVLFFEDFETLNLTSKKEILKLWEMKEFASKVVASAYASLPLKTLFRRRLATL